MADTKLSALTALAVEPADTDELYINDGGTSKKIAWSTVKANIVDAVEGTAILSTGEAGGTKFLRENGDGTCSWQAVSAGLSEVSEDTSPTLGGDLSLGGFKLLSGASDNAVIKLGDNAGTRKLSIQDSDDVEVAYINSDGSIFGSSRVTPNKSNTSAYITAPSGNFELSLHGYQAKLVVYGGTPNVNATTIGNNLLAFSNENNGSAVSIYISNHNFDSFTVKPFNITGQAALSSATTNIVGGGLNLTGGAGASGSAGNAHGGNVTISGGTGYGTGHKGYIILDLSSLPTSDPSVNGALWLDTGTLSVSGA